MLGLMLCCCFELLNHVEHVRCPFVLLWLYAVRLFLGRTLTACDSDPLSGRWLPPGPLHPLLSALSAPFSGGLSPVEPRVAALLLSDQQKERASVCDQGRVPVPDPLAVPGCGRHSSGSLGLCLPIAVGLCVVGAEFPGTRMD